MHVREKARPKLWKRFIQNLLSFSHQLHAKQNLVKDRRQLRMKQKIESSSRLR